MPKILETEYPRQGLKVTKHEENFIGQQKDERCFIRSGNKFEFLARLRPLIFRTYSAQN